MPTKNFPFVYILCCLFCGLFFSARSQSLEDEQTDESDFSRQLWTSFNPSYHLSEKKTIKGDVNYRTVWPHNWSRFIARGGLEINTDGILFKKLKVQENYAYGVGLFYLNSETSDNSFEIRPYQGYRLSFNVSERFAFGQYLRLEERFVFSDGDGNIFGIRLRSQFLGTINLEGLIFREGTGIYFPIGVELFFNIRKTSQFNDVLRISPSMGYQINPGFKIQAGIAYHYIKDEAGQFAKSNDLIFSFKVFKTLNFNKRPNTQPNEPPGETNFQEL